MLRRPTSQIAPVGPTRSLSEGSTSTWWRCAPFLRRAIVIFGAAPGTTCGNHRANYPRHHRTPSGMVFAVQMHEPARKAGCNPYLIPPYKRGGAGSNPAAPTKFVQLDGLIETLVGDSATTAGNHRCMLLTGKGAQRLWQYPLRPPGRAAPTAGTTGTGAVHRAEESAASGRADSCLHRGESDGWRASRGGRAIGWEQDVDLDGDPPSVTVRADRARGHTKAPRSRRVLKLARIAVRALREW